MDVVSWTFGNVGYDQDKSIFIDTCRPNRSISASQARRLVRYVVAGLKASGLQTGDYVCIMSYNHLYYPILCLSIIGAGGCVTGGNPGHTISELAGQLKGCRPRYIITESQLHSKVLAAANECKISSSNIYICDPVDQPLPRECHSWTELLQHGSCDWVTLNSKEAETTPAVLYSTSGTTGLPKSAVMSHAHLIDVASFIEQSSVEKPYAISRLVSLPLLHAFAAPIVHMSALREGISTYLMPRFDLAKFSEAIEKFQITEIPMVPAMMLAAVSSPYFTPSRLKSVRHIWTAGAPLSLAVQNQFRSFLPLEANIVPVYGMTECGWITSLAYPESSSNDTVGKPVPGLSIKIVDDKGNIITKDGQLGELLIHPQHPTLGYLGNPAATAELYHEPGWIKSGDIAYVRKGRYYIVDRKKDIIKVRAWQVSPAELENVLLQDPRIRDVAVLGVPDYGISGEIPHAFIVKSSPTDDLELSEIQNFMTTRLARYKQIEALTIVDSIPRNPAGKILRRRLREELLSDSKVIDSGPTVEVSVLSNGHESLDYTQVCLGPLHPQLSDLWSRLHNTVQLVPEQGDLKSTSYGKRRW